MGCPRRRHCIPARPHYRCQSTETELHCSSCRQRWSIVRVVTYRRPAPLTKGEYLLQRFKWLLPSLWILFSTFSSAAALAQETTPIDELVDRFAGKPPCKNCGSAYRYCPSIEFGRKFKNIYKDLARAEGVPERILRLYDELPNCLACIEAGAVPKLMWVGPHGEFSSQSWDPFTERQVRDAVRKGEFRRYKVALLSHNCDCCPEEGGAGAVKQWTAHWDDLNKERYNNPLKYFNEGVALIYDRTNLGEDPDELKRAAAKGISVAIDTEPPKRDAHPECQACRGPANAVNVAYERWRRSFKAIIETQSALRQKGVEAQAVAQKLYEEGNHTVGEPPDSARDDRLDALYVRLGRLQREIVELQARLARLSAARATLLAELNKANANLIRCGETCKHPPPDQQPSRAIEPIAPTNCDGMGPVAPTTTAYPACKALANASTSANRERACLLARWKAAQHDSAVRQARILGKNESWVSLPSPINASAVRAHQDEAKRLIDALPPGEKKRLNDTVRRDMQDQINPLWSQFQAANVRANAALSAFVKCHTTETLRAHTTNSTPVK